MSRVLLIDGDMIAYRTAAAEERPIDFGETFILSADAEQGRANLDATVEAWVKDLEADHVIMAFTDTVNFRKEVMPSYKSNRDGVRRPLILAQMREHCMTKYDAKIVTGLEADDILGIWATHPKMLREYDERIVVTWDKDLRTVPGLHWNPEKGWKDVKGERIPVIDKVSKREADEAFFAQVLSGDAVDGYPGCPNVGKKRAVEIVRNGTYVFPVEEEIKRGPKAGTIRVQWKTKHVPDPWTCICSHYEKAGLSAEDALQTARVARILRHTDFDFKTREPILWTPTAP